VALQPNNPDVRTDLGTSYWYTGDADKAIASFEKALAIRPNHPGTLFNLGIVKCKARKIPRAQLWFGKNYSRPIPITRRRSRCRC